jgi:hypothetical protein
MPRPKKHVAYAKLRELVDFDFLQQVLVVLVLD